MIIKTGQGEASKEKVAGYINGLRNYSGRIKLGEINNNSRSICTKSRRKIEQEI